MTITKVLLIDDEPDVRQIGRMSLQSVGRWRVVLAESGLEGVDAAGRERPDVILLDMLMPGLDGAGTLARLRAAPETAEIPVIFMTARSKPEEVAQYLALGVAGVIAKPFDPLTLPAEIRRILEERA